MRFFTRKDSAPFDWLVVGLGNPGAKYDRTRHNAGFMALDALARDLGADVRQKRFDALVGKADFSGARLLLMKPQTFMNLSGNAVGSAAGYYRLDPSRVLVLCDDISLPLGRVRVRGDGSAGGHNGLKSIIAQLGSDAFPRIKIGVGGGERRGDELVDWVIGRFSSGEYKTASAAAQGAADAARLVIADGVERAESLINGKIFG